MSRILVIDDDRALVDMLVLAFEDAKHEVFSASDGVDGLRRIESDKPELVISDVNMPRLDGLALCRKLRDAGDSVPIILLTSRDGEIDQALGLDLGADDYVAKPFSTRVLLARVHALLRRQELRRGRPDTAPARVSVGALGLDPERLEARYRGIAFEVTVTEFHLIETLAAHPGRVFSRTRLLELLRDDGSVVAERIIDTYVRRIRRKLETIDPDFAELETVIGAGYRWRSE